MKYFMKCGIYYTVKGIPGYKFENQWPNQLDFQLQFKQPQP